MVLGAVGLFITSYGNNKDDRIASRGSSSSIRIDYF